MDIVAFLKENWAVIAQAPWVFVALVVLVGGGGYALGRYMVSEKVANLESRLAARDDQIVRLKEQVAASPDEKGGDTRHFIVGQLIGQYLSAHPDPSPRMKMGLEQPPVEWINAELAKLEEDWRVKKDPQGQYQIYELPRWG